MPQLPPVLGFVAFSGTGKTTLLTRLIPALRQQGLHLGLVKHTHHNFDIDIPGKDSYELRKAGAEQVLAASRRRWALITETPHNEQDPDLAALLPRLDTTRLDLILVEGFKHAAVPKIELHRPALGHPLLYPEDPHVIAVATDAPLPVPPAVPHLDLNDTAAMAKFVLEFARRDECRKP